jgi:hypothetical protein
VIISENIQVDKRGSDKRLICHQVEKKDKLRNYECNIHVSHERPYVDV